MGKKDILTKMYLGQNDIFADAFNYYMFDGKPFIKPSDLIEQDNNELSFIKNTDKIFASQKFRDVLKLCNIRYFEKSTLILLGIEGQSSVHNTMPVRDYLYDALNYAAQIEDIKRKHEQEHDLEGNDILSGFSKEDHIMPVITLCICFDKNAWNGSRSIYDMFDNVPQEILKYVNNYKLNLITPDEIIDFGKFNSELGTVLNFIQISDNKQAMYDILKSGKFGNVSTRTIDMINEYTGAKIPTGNIEGGQIDMGNAWNEIIADKQLEARNEGRIEGANELATILMRLKENTTVQSLINEGFNPDIVKEAENLLVAINQ